MIQMIETCAKRWVYYPSLCWLSREEPPPLIRVPVDRKEPVANSPKLDQGSKSKARDEVNRFDQFVMLGSADSS